MKKLLALLLLLLLPWTALADGPASFCEALRDGSPADFARACEAALADTSLAGATVAEKDGVPVVAWDDHYAFAVMRRTDGLLMLCHFTPAGEKVLLEWHNDLLLSWYQELAFSERGAKWSGGEMPEMCMNENWTFAIGLLQPDGTQLRLTADLYRDGWRVEALALDTRLPDGTWWTTLQLPEGCLADDIYLATCKPDDWRRGETEEEVAYGW